MPKWINQGGTWIASTPSKPGVWRTRDGGFLIRSRPTNPRTGKQVAIRRVLKCTLEEAATTLHQEIQVVRSGGSIHAKRKNEHPRFAEYAEELFQHKMATGVIRSAATRKAWRYALQAHLLPRYGDFYIDQLRRADLLEYHTVLAQQVTEKKMKPSTATAIFAKLKHVIRCYMSESDLERDPTVGIKGFDKSLHRTYTREDPNSLLPHEVTRFLAAARRLYPHTWAMIALGFATGLRTCSLRPLRRKGPSPDVDLELGMLFNRRSHTHGQEIMERTKIGVDQEIALPEELVDILREHIEGLPPGPMQDSDLLFPDPAGRISQPRRLRKIFHLVAVAAGLNKRISPHGMRRTSKDLLRLAGASQEVSMAISGHLTKAMHYHYSTVGEGEQRASLRKVLDMVQLGSVSPDASGKECGKDRPARAARSRNLRREKPAIKPGCNTSLKKRKPVGSVAASTEEA